MDPSNWTETARRVRAAMAYGKIQRAEAAAVMGTKPGTLDRIIGTKSDDTKVATWEQLRRLAAHVELPPEWFSADLERLPEIVPAGGVTFVRPVGGVPPIPGETGHHLGEGPPTDQGQERPDSDQGPDIAEGDR